MGREGSIDSQLREDLERLKFVGGEGGGSIDSQLREDLERLKFVGGEGEGID